MTLMMILFSIQFSLSFIYFFNVPLRHHQHHMRYHFFFIFFFRTLQYVERIKHSPLTAMVHIIPAHIYSQHSHFLDIRVCPVSFIACCAFLWLMTTIYFIQKQKFILPFSLHWPCLSDIIFSLTLCTYSIFMFYDVLHHLV